MKSTIKELLNILYESYSFVEPDQEKFKQIISKSVPSYLEDKEYLKKGRDSLIKYIVSEIENKRFANLFEKAVKVLKTRKAFEVYNLIIQETNVEVDGEDLLAIATNKKYEKFYSKAEGIDNELLESVLAVRESSNEDAEEIEKQFTEISTTVSDDIVKDYFKYIKDIPVLTREEEQELIKKYRETNDKAYKDEFIEHNLKLAAKIAVKIRNQRYNELKMDLMDLIQEGNEGLLKAFDKFDETKGFKFSTYATTWIRQRITRAIRNKNDVIRIPVHQGERLSKKYKFIKNYKDKYGVEPTDKEIMKYLEIGPKEYKLLTQAEEIKSPTSIDLTIDSEETKQGRETSFSNFLADEKTSHLEDEILDKYQGEQLLQYAKEVLTEKEYKVMLDRWGFNEYQEALTLETIGKRKGVTRERIRQIQEKSITKLHRKSYMITREEDRPTDVVYSREDLLEKLSKKGIYNITVLQYRQNSARSVFFCDTCKKRFTEDPIDLLKRGKCPNCSEKAKEKVKNK
jgi:RNA polymerase primary sigma factor